MGTKTYSQEKLLLPGGLDELALRKSLTRISDEDFDSFRQRLLLETRDPSGATEKQFIKSVGRQVGSLDVPVFRITLDLDGSGLPLAADPYIEITSTWIRAYSDFDNETLDFEHNLTDRSDAYFLREVKTAFDGSTFFSAAVLDTAYTFKRADHLRFENTIEYVTNEPLTVSRSNKLANNHIRDFRAQAAELFQDEKNDYASVAEPGDFYIDYVAGVVFTNDPARGFVSYSYSVFPFILYWQPVRSFPLVDEDTKYSLRDTLISDTTGAVEYTNLNSKGAKYYNEVLELHPLGYGD